ncbi:MAG: T9SS type A sorting domain-containing protein [Flavobacteriales bacterium]
MKKHILILSILLLTTVGQELIAQTTTGFWINPINQVPFAVTYVDSTLQAQGDSLISEFSGETTFHIDSGIVAWNPVSDSIYQAIFGYNIDVPAQTLSYDELLLGNVSMVGEWDVVVWDSLIYNESWIENRSLKLSSANMGALVGWDWYAMSGSSAKLLLDPTVPVIEGEDMDYAIDVPENVNLTFDIDDYKSTGDEMEAVFNHGIYTFNKPDFKLTYNGFVEWMIDTKPFYPDSFDLNTYHDWLYEYFSPIADAKISEILSIDYHKNELKLIKISDSDYKLTGNLSNNSFRILNVQGQVLLAQKFSDNQTFSLQNFPKGIYFLAFQSKSNELIMKILNQ